MGEAYAIHRARHIDVGEHDMDIALPLKNVDRFVGIGRRISFESGCLDCLMGNLSNERFVLDNENAHQLMLPAHPDITTHAG